MSRARSALAAIAVLAATCATPALAKCGINMLEGWEPEKTRWIGPCKDGMAEGEGVLIYTAIDREQGFYGTFENGWIVNGAIDARIGYKAVRFLGHQVLMDESKPVQVQAFRAAAQAAEEAAEIRDEIGRIR